MVNDNTSYEKLLGNIDISNIGDGTITGAISKNAQGLSNVNVYVKDNQLHFVDSEGADSVIPFNYEIPIVFMVVTYNRSSWTFQAYRQNIDENQSTTLLEEKTFQNNSSFFHEMPFTLNKYIIKSYSAKKFTTQFTVEFMGKDFSISRTTTGNVGYTLRCLKFAYTDTFYVQL